MDGETHSVNIVVDLSRNIVEEHSTHIHIYDSNFASLLGEFGYIGALIYYIFFILICLKVSEFYGYRNTTEFKFVFFVFFTIYSVTGPVFMNTYQIVIFIIILLAAAHKKITRETPMQIDTVKVK